VAGAPYLQVNLAEKTYRRLGEQGVLLTGLDVPAAGICDLIQRMNVVFVALPQFLMQLTLL